MGILKKIFGQKTSKTKIGRFDPNNNDFGEKLLNFFKKIISQNVNTPVKTGWIKKKDVLPLITITKTMDEVQKLYKTKMVSFDFNIWCKDKKTRDTIANKTFKPIENIDFDNLEINLSNPRILNFEEKYGIYRYQFDITINAKVNVEKKELKKLEDYEEKCKYYDKLVLGDLGGVGGKLLESKDKKYALFNPVLEKKILALIRDNKILWKRKFENIVDFALASDGSYGITVTQLTKKEMPKDYKSGGHIYVISKEGKTKNIRIPCDGLSCSISPDNKYFGITTMGPEWGIYYFNNKGKLLWKKQFNKDVGGIEVTNKDIILYDKMHKETRKKVFKLDKKGNIIKK